MHIGITEAGDGGLDLSWGSKLREVDAAVIVTKQLTPGCRQLLLENQNKCVLHMTITGYGGTVVEPNVPDWHSSLARLVSLVDEGFPREQVVVRVDPIIPTEKGIETAYRVLCFADQYGFKRFRVSIIDMYPHVRQRFKEAGLPLPYNDSFSPPPSMVAAVDEMMEVFKSVRPDVTVESCAERLQNAVPCGCVSGKDLDILGIPHSSLDQLGPQRAGCLCCSAKTELLKNKHRCPHQCLYCYWR